MVVFIPGRQILRNSGFDTCQNNQPVYWEVEGGRCCSIIDIGSAVCRDPNAQWMRLTQYVFTEFLVGAGRAYTYIQLPQTYADSHVIIDLDYGAINDYLQSSSPFTVTIDTPPFNIAVLDSNLTPVPWRIERYDPQNRTVRIVARAVESNVAYIGVNRLWRFHRGGIAPEERVEKGLAPPWDYPDSGPGVFAPIYWHWRYGLTPQSSCTGNECWYELGSAGNNYFIEIGLDFAQSALVASPITGFRLLLHFVGDVGQYEYVIPNPPGYTVDQAIDMVVSGVVQSFMPAATLYAWCSDQNCTYGVFARLGYVVENRVLRLRLFLGYIDNGNENVLSTVDVPVIENGLRLEVHRAGANVVARIFDLPHDTRIHTYFHQPVVEVSGQLPGTLVPNLGEVARLYTRDVEPVFARAHKSYVYVDSYQRIYTMWHNKTNCVRVYAKVVISQQSVLRFRLLGPQGENLKEFTLTPNVPGEQNVIEVVTDFAYEDFPIWGFQIETNADAVADAGLYGCITSRDASNVFFSQPATRIQLFELARQFTGYQVLNIATEGRDIPWLCKTRNCAIAVNNVVVGTLDGRQTLFDIARQFLGFNVDNVYFATPTERLVFQLLARTLQGIEVVNVHVASHCPVGLVPWRIHVVDVNCNPVEALLVFVMGGQAHLVETSRYGYALLCLPQGQDPNQADIKLAVDRQGRVSLLFNVTHLVRQDMREVHYKDYYVYLAYWEQLGVAWRLPSDACAKLIRQQP